MCAIEDWQIFVSGGSASDHNEKSSSDKAELYRIYEDEWVELPRLVKGRREHAMCALGLQGALYVFGGSDMDHNQEAGIERLDLYKLDCWVQLRVLNMVQIDWTWHSVMPLNDTEILVLGGSIGVFNTQTCVLRKENESHGIPQIKPKYYPCVL